MSLPSENDIIAAIRPVRDPDLDLGIGDVGLLRGVDIAQDTGHVRVELTLTSPMCPMAPQLIEAVRAKTIAVPGVNLAFVDLVWSPPWDPRTDATDDVKAELGIWD